MIPETKGNTLNSAGTRPGTIASPILLNIKYFSINYFVYILRYILILLSHAMVKKLWGFLKDPFFPDSLEGH